MRFVYHGAGYCIDRLNRSIKDQVEVEVLDLTAMQVDSFHILPHVHAAEIVALLVRF